MEGKRVLRHWTRGISRHFSSLLCVQTWDLNQENHHSVVHSQAQGPNIWTNTLRARSRWRVLGPLPKHCQSHGPSLNLMIGISGHRAPGASMTWTRSIFQHQLWAKHLDWPRILTINIWANGIIMSALEMTKVKKKKKKKWPRWSSETLTNQPKFN